MEPSVINVSNEVRVSVTLVLNAMEKPSKSILTSNLATCIALGLLALAAVLLNLCVLLAILCSGSLKKVTINQLVSHMSLACFLDCVINVPFAMYYIKTNSWLLGPTLCTLNAATVLFATLLVAWILCYMCMERCFALHKLCTTKRCSLFCKQRVAIGTIIVIISCVIFPVATSFVEVRAFPSRYSCYVATDNEVSYRVILVISFCIPIVIAMICLLSAYVKNFQGIKDINCQRTELSYTELFFEESHLWNEWQTSKFVGVVMMLFILLEIPVILTFMRSTSVSLKATELSNIQNSTVKVSYPSTQITSSIEKTYYWCKYAFCLAYPLATLILRKDIKRKVTVLLSFCRSGSSIPHNSVESPVSQEEYSDDFLVPQGWRRRRLSSVTYLKSPIIFGKSRSGSLQFMDMTTGIAKWKASYDEPKTNKVDRPFFADIFDDEDELTEFASFHDFTEEELNSSELGAVPSTSKDVAVQTAQKELLRQTSADSCYNISDTKQYRCVYDGRIEKCRTRKNRRQSKSFTCNRTNTAGAKYKYYMTFPKMSQSPEIVDDAKDTFATSDLLRALQIKRSKRNSITVCDLLPRGTAELFDSPVESRDIVSL